MSIDTSKEAIEALLAGVTPGPWRIKDCESAGYRCANYHQEIWNEDTDILVTTEATRAHNDGGAKNMRFIRAARDLVPALLAERDDARAEVERLKAKPITVHDVVKVPEVQALIEALKPFADIGVSENPDFHPIIRMDRDAIMAARAALTTISDIK